MSVCGWFLSVAVLLASSTPNWVVGGGGMGWEKGFWWSMPVAVCFSMYLHGHHIYVRHSLLSLFVLCAHEVAMIFALLDELSKA